MCEPACIKYTGGSTFKCSDLDEARTVAKRTYQAAVELFAMLCEEYGLNPLADGVIISHKEGHARGIASNHGDPEHLWKQLGLSFTMDTFRKAVKEKMEKEVEPEKKEEYPEKLTEGYYRVCKTWKDSNDGRCVPNVPANTGR